MRGLRVRLDAVMDVQCTREKDSPASSSSIKATSSVFKNGWLQQPWGTKSLTDTYDGSTKHHHEDRCWRVNTRAMSSAYKTTSNYLALNIKLKNGKSTFFFHLEKTTPTFRCYVLIKDGQTGPETDHTCD